MLYLLKKKQTMPKSKNRRRGTCKRKYTLKYTQRKSPAYQANSSSCRGKIKKGNDGKKYKSVSIMRQGKQIYIWRRWQSRN